MKISHWIGMLMLIVFIDNAKGQTTTLENKCMECHTKVTEKRVIHKPVALGCNSCHQSKNVEHPKEDVEGFVLVKEVPELCFSCHNQQEIMKEQVHPPLKEGDCLSCHDVHSSKNDHLISANPPGLCYSCHSDLETMVNNSSVQHGALKEGNTCMNCHSPHSSSEKKVLLKPEPDVCFSCHDKEMKSGDRTIINMKVLVSRSKYVHGAIENNGCSVCHNPHASANQNLLNKSLAAGNYSAITKNSYELCMDCHEKALYEEQVTEEATGFRNGDKNLHFLHINKDKGRTCSNCHNVHASNQLFLIAEKVKFGNWNMPINFKKLPKGGSCAPGCHVVKEYTR